MSEYTRPRDNLREVLNRLLQIAEEEGYIIASEHDGRKLIKIEVYDLPDPEPIATFTESDAKGYVGVKHTYAASDLVRMIINPEQ